MGWKKQLVNSTFSSKHKSQTRTRAAIWLWWTSPVLQSKLALLCRLTAQGNPRHPYQATCHRDKGWGPSLPGSGSPGALHLLLRGKERTEQAGGGELPGSTAKDRTHCGCREMPNQIPAEKFWYLRPKVEKHKSSTGDKPFTR